MHVPILMYHSVRERPPKTTAALAVTPGAFADQMALLADRGFTPLPFGSLHEAHKHVKPVVITFDDGYADFHDHALPVLERHGFASTVFVTTGWLADAGPEAAGKPLDTMLSWSQVREATAHGVEIGGHSHSHPQLDQLGDAELRDELTRNRGLLEDRLSAPVTTMAYPYGYSSARVRRAVRAAGYETACAVANRTATPERNTTPTIRDDDVLTVPRLTVRMSTTLDTFAKVADGRGLPLIFLKDHALTKGYAVLRRARYAVRKTTGRV